MDTPNTPPVTNTSVPAPTSMPPASAPLTEAQLAKQKQASYGAIFIIVLILGMIIVGAFYAWGQRISQGQSAAPTTTTTN